MADLTKEQKHCRACGVELEPGWHLSRCGRKECADDLKQLCPSIAPPSSKTVTDLRYHAPHVTQGGSVMTKAADELERAGRIMRRAISWLQIKEAAFSSRKGPAIIEEMQRFVEGLPDETAGDDVGRAWDVFRTKMRDDPEYAWSWHCNLAMPIKDAVACTHLQANEAAASLMQHLFAIDTRDSPHFPIGAVEPTSPRLLRVDRSEAEFIVDAAERTRIPQWMELAAEIRRLWGMGSFPAGAVPPNETIALLSILEDEDLIGKVIEEYNAPLSWRHTQRQILWRYRDTLKVRLA